MRKQNQSGQDLFSTTDSVRRSRQHRGAAAAAPVPSPWKPDRRTERSSALGQGESTRKPKSRQLLQQAGWHRNAPEFQSGRAKCLCPSARIMLIRAILHFKSHLHICFVQNAHTGRGSGEESPPQRKESKGKFQWLWQLWLVDMEE